MISNPNFKIYRQDSHTKPGASVPGLGLICHIIECLPDLEINSNVYHIENFIFELTIKREKQFFIFIFKHPKVPNKEFTNKLTKVCDSIINKGKEITLLGDLNIYMSCEDK